MGISYIQLDQESTYLALFVDASFAGNADFSSQLWFILTLMDKDGKANVIHYSSTKSRRVARSVLSAELLAMMHDFDITSTISLSVQEIYGRNIPVRIYTDSKCLYDNVVTLGSTTEKRMLIDLSILRESYECREIDDIYWIPSCQNPADAFTKKGNCTALFSLMQENKLLLTPNAWEQRPRPSWTKKAN